VKRLFELVTHLQVFCFEKILSMVFFHNSFRIAISLTILLS